MKKILLLIAAATMAVCSCNKEPEQTPKEDSVSINPASKAFGAEGGSVDVTVTSSGEWLLDGDCSWVAVSAASGENGDVVTFTVEPNETYEALNTTYTFMVGEKTAEFGITVAAHALPVFELTSESSVNMSCAAGQFNVVLDTDVAASDIKCKISDDAASWLKFYSVEGSTLTFSVQENAEYEVRTGTVTLSADMCDDIVVNVSQNAKSKIVLDAEKYECKAEASEITITVTEANVEYEAVVPEAYQDWISVKSVADGTITLDVAATEDSREGKVQVVAVDGTLTVEAVIAQVAAAKGAAVTEIDALGAGWILYKESPYWTVEVNNYTSADWIFKNFDPDTAAEPMKFFWDDGTENKIRGNVSGGFEVIVDMKSLFTVSGIRIRYHGSRGDTSLKLYASNDKEEWVELGTFGDGATNKENRYFECEGLECRYVKYVPLGESNSIGVQLFNMMFYHL